MISSQHWIQTLELQPHPEGGFYKETYRSSLLLDLPDGRKRCASTLIYYLLGPGDRSHLHRLQSDEIWYYHSGSPLDIIQLTESGHCFTTVLGPHTELGEHLHLPICSGIWFGAEPKDPDGYSLLSCSVSPGFEFDDFELADRGKLLHSFPKHKTTIERFTRAR